MAHLRCDVFADSLGMSTSLTVLLPERAANRIGLAGSDSAEPPPVLYLLHGLSDDDTAWLRRTAVERYVAPRGWAVVMPQVQRSFYTDEAVGGAYWSYVSDELPALVASMFRVSTERADTAVAGLSMGGYGAMKLALRQPERFVAAASLSGVLALRTRFGRPVNAVDPRMWERVFGPDAAALLTLDREDPTALLADADPAALPALYACCGTEDVLYPDNLGFAAAAREAGVALTTRWSSGGHEWGYWDAELPAVLDFLDAARVAARG